MTKPQMGPDIGHRRAAPLTPPRWLRLFPPVWSVLTRWFAGFPVGYDLTRSVANGPKPRGAVQGTSTAAGPHGGAAPRGISVAPPPLLPPIAPTPTASTEPHEHGNAFTPPTRKRTVLLPRPRPSPLTPDSQPPRTGMITRANRHSVPRQYLTHPIVDNTPQTWNTQPRRSARPMPLLPYPWSELER
jgi:hypothetical protein